MRTKRLSAVLCLIAMLAVMILGTIQTHAVLGSVEGDPMTQLLIVVAKGEYQCKTTNKNIVVNDHKYKKTGGGTMYYSELVVQDASKITKAEAVLNSSTFDTLKSTEKKDFLGDMLLLVNAVTTDTANGYNVGSGAPTDDTAQEFMRMLESESGMGSTLLATLMQNTKPDFVTANRIYEPFSGVVGTILGVISIIIMALLGITMALDIAFIVIPAFQLAMGADGSGENGKDNANKMSRLISSEARQAVQANGDSNGSGGQSGSDKQALGIYFKKRWKSLVLLGICLLYLVSGQIYSLVAWIIDLVSGFTN